MMRRSNTATAIAIVLHCSAANAGHDEWHLASRTDSVIRHWLEQTLPVAQQAYDENPRGAVVVLQEVVGDVGWDRYDQWDNAIYWIREPSGEKLSNYELPLPDFRTLEQVDAFCIRSGSTAIKTVLDAKIEHLGRDKFKTLDPDGDQRDRVILIQFPTLQPGDILAWSLHTTWHATLSSISIPVASTYPVGHAQVRLYTGEDFKFTHVMTGFAPGQAVKTVLRKDKDIEREVALTARRIAPLLEEPFGPPGWRQTPRFFLVMHQYRQMSPWGLKWMNDDSWNYVGQDLDWYADALERRTKTLPQLVAEIHSGEVSDFAPATAAYLHIRDRFLDATSPTKRDKYPDFDAMIQDRSGSPLMKAYLLRAVLLKMGYEFVDVLFAHDPQDGEFHSEYPSRNQVTQPLVRVRLRGQEQWFDIDCKLCPPGSLRPRLNGQVALYVKRGIQAEADQLFERATSSSIDWIRSSGEYRARVINSRWTRLERTPGNRRDLAGWIDERVRYSPTSAATGLELTLAFRGLNPARTLLDASTSRESFVESWLKARFESAAGVKLNATPRSESDTTVVYAQAQLSALPQPIEDTWILPPELVYGDPSVDRWPSERRTGFWAEYTTRRTWELRLPLPEGWTDVEFPPSQKFASEHVLYSWGFAQEGSEFLVRRQLQIVAGDVSDPPSVAKIGETLLAIHNLESAPVVVKRMPRVESQ